MQPKIGSHKLFAAPTAAPTAQNSPLSPDLSLQCKQACKKGKKVDLIENQLFAADRHQSLSLNQHLPSICIGNKQLPKQILDHFFCIANVFFVFPKKSVSSGHKPALVPDKWIFFCKVFFELYRK